MTTETSLERNLQMFDIRRTSGTPCSKDLRDGEPPCIVHVEDDCDFSIALKRRLEAHGVAVVRAFDGEQGIEAVQKHRADAVILDVEMPRCGGDEVLRWIMGNAETSGMPVIMLSCRKDPVFRQRMLDQGATAFLAKPLEFEQLLGVLAQHIDVIPTPQCY